VPRTPFSLLLLSVPLASCRALKNFDLIEIADAKAHNLEQLHQRDGRHAYVGALVGDVEYLLRTGLRLGEGGALTLEPAGVAVPEKECLENLVALARFDPADERVASLQILWACRVATECPWGLSRERAVRVLGEAGERLAIGPPAGLAPDTPVADAADVGRVLGRVLAALVETPTAVEGSVDLGEACEAVGALVLDVAGGRRVLFALGRLLSDPRRTDRERASLAETLRDVEERCISQTLASALGDEDPRVRSAAVEAAVRSGGPGVLAIVLPQVDREPNDEVTATVLRLVTAGGLPEREEGIDAGDYARARERWLGQLVRHAVEHPAGLVRVQAMRALSTVAPGGPGSLRSEDWEAWWFARAAPAVEAAATTGPGR
jgi:hypothetical protein